MTMIHGLGLVTLFIALVSFSLGYWVGYTRGRTGNE